MNACRTASHILISIPSGVASFEQIIVAVREGFNMEYEIASALTAFAMVKLFSQHLNQHTQLVPFA